MRPAIYYAIGIVLTLNLLYAKLNMQTFAYKSIYNFDGFQETV